MIELSDLFGLFALGIGTGTLLSAFYGLLGSFVAFCVRIVSAD